MDGDAPLDGIALITWMGLHLHEWIDCIFDGVIQEVTRLGDFGVFGGKLENSDK